jgi:hypothetical protein
MSHSLTIESTGSSRGYATSRIGIAATQYSIVATTQLSLAARAKADRVALISRDAGSTTDRLATKGTGTCLTDSTAGVGIAAAEQPVVAQPLLGQTTGTIVNRDISVSRHTIAVIYAEAVEGTGHWI